MLDLEVTKFVLLRIIVFGLDESSPEDAEGFMESARRVKEVVNAEMENGIKTENMVIGGFSQGGALALHYTLRSKYKFAGVAALSTWLPLRGDYPGAISEEAKSSLRLFQAHGAADEVVQLLPWGQSSHMQLKEWLGNGEDFQFMEIANMGHSSDHKEIDALNKASKRERERERARD